MEKKFEYILNLNHDSKISSDGYLEKLEIIRREKEAIIKNDEEIEMDNQNLWIEAREIKHQMELSSSINQQLEVDSEEMNEIFKKINDERGKLIQQELVPQIDPSVPQPVFTITEKAPTRAFSWLKAPTSAFTFKTLLRHYAKRALTPR